MANGAPQISSITVAWGIVMLGMGWVTKWWQLVICRALLGMLEAGFFPACELFSLYFVQLVLTYKSGAYIISTWYVRREIQKRLTGFYVVAVMVSRPVPPCPALHQPRIQVGGFSSAISGGIAGLAGQRGLNGWQWIFIIFGAVTVFGGIISFFRAPFPLHLAPPF
jgi:MFS family permease